MVKNIIARRYLLSINGRFNKYVIVIGERDKLDEYVVSKFGYKSISSSEDLDGYPILTNDVTDESTESVLLNNIFYK